VAVEFGGSNLRAYTRLGALTVHIVVAIVARRSGRLDLTLSLTVIIAVD